MKGIASRLIELGTMLAQGPEGHCFSCTRSFTVSESQALEADVELGGGEDCTILLFPKVRTGIHPPKPEASDAERLQPDTRANRKPTQVE